MSLEGKSKKLDGKTINNYQKQIKNEIPAEELRKKKLQPKDEMCKI